MKKWALLVVMGLLSAGFLIPGNPAFADKAAVEDYANRVRDIEAQFIPQAAVELITNGDFETPLVPFTGIRRFPRGSSIGAAWQVSRGNVDLLGPLWNAAKGKQSLDLSGNRPGTVFQDITTVPGRFYLLSFWMAGNPDGLPLIKTMRVFRGGRLLATLTFDTFEKTRDKMGWEFKQLRFRAVAANTRIRFVSLTSSPFGPAIDAVSVVEEPL